MCLVIDLDVHEIKGKRPAPLIADKDYYVLKFVSDWNFEQGHGVSFFRKAKQHANTILKSRLTKQKVLIGDYRVYQGLHSVSAKSIMPRSKALFMWDSANSDSTLLLAKIPKGAKYYKGCGNDIVSNRLILIEPLVTNDPASTLEQKVGPSDLIEYLMIPFAIDILQKEGYSQDDLL